MPMNQTDDQTPSPSLSSEADDANVAVFDDPVESLDTPLDTPPQKARERDKEKPSPAIEKLLTTLSEQPSIELKLNQTVAFMEQALAQSGTPQFKQFWDARKICLDLLMENNSVTNKATIWQKYTDLSQEARRLKEILSEQSSFAVEQIGIAIDALEATNNSPIVPLNKQSEEYINACRSLDTHAQLYCAWQAELDHLNHQAVRINTLRKELIQVEMRIRHKNKFFQRLSTIGDKVFPRRKDLIKEISQHFTQDVDAFMNTNFVDGAPADSLAFYRDEIKLLQNIAKMLTINTSAFTQTRMTLSKCWDHIKHSEKERKREQAKLRTLFKQNAQQISDELGAFEQALTAGMPTAEAQAKIEAIVSLMRQTELGREEVRELHSMLDKARSLLQARMHEEERQRTAIEFERDNARKEAIHQLRAQIDDLLTKAHDEKLETLTEAKENLLTAINEASISKGEKAELEKLLRPLKDLITEKKERALLSLSADDRESLTQLQEILQQRKERRQEIKKQLESLRKIGGTSGLDFEKAMSVNEQIAIEKERLDKANEGIEEIEAKIAFLEEKQQQ
jgi:hypothetical protein